MGSDLRSFLTVVRSLGRCGLEVHTAWSRPDSPALRSRHIRVTHDVEKPSRDSDRWATQFSELLEREKFDLVIPCNDPSLIPLQENRQQWGRYSTYLLNEHSYRVACDKAESGNLVRSLGIAAPKERLITAGADSSVLSELRAPFVLKPIRSFSPSRLDRKNHVVHAASVGEVEHKLEQLLPHTAVLVQEFFPGIGVGVEFLADHGTLLVDFQHIRLHEPPSGGGSSYRRSSPVEAELRDATSKIARALDYSGVGMVEFRYNFKTREWIFVEINGRFWGSLPLAVAAGADFPRFLFEYLVEGRREFENTYKVDVACRNVSLDARWFIDSVRAAGLDLRRQLKLGMQLVAELRYPLTMRSYSDTFAWDDLRPGWTELTQIVRNVLTRLGAGTRLFRDQRFPFRQRLQSRCRIVSVRQPSVLFVCKGNICRSPFAEEYARRVLPDGYRVASCGYFPVAHRPCPSAAVQAAREFQVDLTSHRSQVLTAELIDQAGAILTFDEENRQTVLATFPSTRRKVFPLGAFSSARDVMIADPYGGSVEDFRATYERIKDAVDRYARRVAAIPGSAGC